MTDMSSSAILIRIKECEDRIKEESESSSSNEEELQQLLYEKDCWENMLYYGVANPYAW